MFSLEVLKDRDASKIFAGQAISQLCDKMMTLGLVWVIASAGSIRLVPWYLAAGALPHLLLARFSGPWVERLGPLKTTIVTDLARGAIYLAAALVWTQKTDISFLFLITILSNCASALFNPAILSLPMRLPLAKKDLLPQLTAMVDSCFSLGNVLGPAAAAILYPFLGLSGLFVLNAASYILAGVLETCVSLAPSEPIIGANPGDEKTERKVAQAKLALTEDGLLRYLLINFFFMNLVLSPLLAFLPIFAKTLFDGEIGALAAMETALGVGTVLGGLALTLVKSQGKTGQRVIASLFVIGLMQLLFSMSRDSRLSCIVLFILGISLSVINVTLLTFFQTRPAESDVPKVMSYVNLISVGAIPLSMTMVGGLLEVFPIRAFAIVLSIIFFGLASLITLNPEVRSA